MNLIVATIPDDPADLAPWLERRLVGLELDGLVAELAAIHKPAGGSLSLTTVLDGQLDRVRAAGLSCLSREQIRALMTRPGLLLELQEDVLCFGGAYWDRVARTMPVMQMKVEEGRQRLALPRTALGPRPSSGHPRAWFAVLAMAAAVLLAVGGWWFVTSGPRETQLAAWGWDRPGAIDDDATATEYLEALAKAGDEWFAKRPDGRDALKRRVGEMRQGCDTLIGSPHRPLAEKDREWLIERCKAWRKEFDSALGALDEGKEPAEVREKMDKVVEKLTTALRARAKQVA